MIDYNRSVQMGKREGSWQDTSMHLNDPKLRWWLTTTTAWALLLFSCEASAMAPLAKHYVLFSEISGTITIDGRPVANSRVVRRVRKAHTVDTDLTDETTTDEHGYFAMPALKQKSLMATFLPMAFGVPQELFVHYDGMEHKIWSASKMDPSDKAESKGKPLVVACDLTNEKKMIRVSGGTIFSKCQWDVEPDVEEPLMTPDEIEEFKRRNEEERKLRENRDA